MELNQEIWDIARAIREAVPVERIYLFGSYAYGTPNEDSDYDFFVVIPDGDLKPIEAGLRARRSLAAIQYATPVDILADTQSSFDTRRQFKTLERKVFSEGVVLYERT